ncbi:ribonuclease BN family protein [Geotalea daltonii FRC-32]|uniref:Ribonuclease BN family protein n=1 Tax=Geotalea daltonii (strain DSM 22248 / JCM 15807 / FRC-32) TaxID=316067 RepID=B9M0U8_GEODF|nr:YihY/virulence factor BrkB family protein [Geotalea daltonii]ACM20951.1 ribonuclease BN family protein [Geotalea daltonii FRC-32]
MFSFRRYFKLGDLSYKELGKRVYGQVTDHGCAAYAAAMAYYLLFALFPFFLFLTTLIGYLPIPGLLDFILTTMQRFLPEQAFSLVQDNVKSLFGNKQGGLLSLGFVLALWTSSNAITSIMDIMNRLYQVQEGRPFWKVRLTAIALVTVLSVLFILSLVLLMFGPKLGSFIAGITHLGHFFEILWNILIAPATLFMLMLAIAIIYYFTPDVEQNWKWISPGAVIAIPVWVLASLAFSFYVNNFGSYNKTYGSIGAVIILLFWLYISGFIILAGAEINSAVEHSSAEGKEPGEKVEGEREGEAGAKGQKG